MIYQKPSQYNSEKERPDIPNAEESIDLQEYQEQRSHYLEAKFQPALIPQNITHNHNITILRQSNKLLSSTKGTQQLPSQFFSIIQTQFNGLQYTYEVVIGPFRLKILVLNLLREADSGGDDYNVQELGVGTFGTVSEIKLKEGTSFATKRIPFRFKLNPDQGYDYEQKKAEEVQLKRCLKQFCFYKIFSLLNIGPKVISSGYDLICFNNCIEFKMELCEPINNQFSARDIEIEQCTKDLCWRLFMLHSMNIIHRDIKPENILYSPSQKQFVFGDFGMVSVLKEGYRQKTGTRFMGTPNYCGQEMKALLNGGFGYVNLYLNDFHALKLTLCFLNSNFIGQNSKITSNSLSFNQYQTSFFGSGSFEAYENSNNSCEQVGTDQSPNPTRNSLATLPTTCTLAPKKYASLINHFESEIIYEICRAMERKTSVSKETINEFILRTYSEHQNQQILTNLYIEITDIFQTDDPVKLLVKQWSNSSRHYGPEHYLTINILQQIVSRVDEKTAAAIKDVEKKIVQGRGHYRPDTIELAMYRQLNNIKGFIYSFISTLKSSIRLKNYNYQIEEINEQAVQMAQYYIEGIYRILPYCAEAAILTKLVLKYFGQPELSNEPNQIRVDCAMAFCYSYLMNRGQCSIRSTYRYLIYLLEDIKGVNWSYREHLIINAIERIVKSIESSPEEDKVTFINLVLFMANYHQFYNSSIDMSKLLDLAQALISELIERSGSLKDSQNTFLLLYAKANLLYLSKHFQAAIEQCKLILSHYQTQNIRHSTTDQFHRIEVLNLIASIYIQNYNYQLAAEHLNQALKLVESDSGSLYRPKHVYNILNNILVIKHRQHHYSEALQKAEELIEFLLKAEFPKKEIKIIRSYHLCINLSFLVGITQESKERVKHYLTQIADILYGFIGQSDVWAELSATYVDFVAGGVSHLQLSQTFFIYQRLIEVFESRKQYRDFFCYQYAAAYYQLAKYYIRDLRQHLKGMKYLWNYLKVILNQHLPPKLREIDYQIIYIYAKCLVKNQCNRHAIRLLTQFLKYIPELYSEIKLKCLELVNKAMETVANPRLKLYNELSKNRCKKVREKSFKAIVRSVARNQFEEKLYGKQLKGMFLVDIEEVDRPSALAEGDQV